MSDVFGNRRMAMSEQRESQMTPLTKTELLKLEAFCDAHESMACEAVRPVLDAYRALVERVQKLEEDNTSLTNVGCTQIRLLEKRKEAITALQREVEGLLHDVQVQDEAYVRCASRLDEERERGNGLQRACDRLTQNLAMAEEQHRRDMQFGSQMQIQCKEFQREVERLTQERDSSKHHYDQLKEAYDATVAGVPLGPIVGAQTIMNQVAHILKLEQQLAALRTLLHETTTVLHTVTTPDSKDWPRIRQAVAQARAALGKEGG